MPSGGAPSPKAYSRAEDPPPISVLLAGPRDVAGLGLKELLARDPRFSLLADRAFGIEAAVQRLWPELLILDPQAGGRLDLDLVTTLARAAPRSHICLHTGLFEPRVMLDGLLAGARGYLLKGQGSNEVVLSGLTTVARGGISIDPAVTEYLREHGTTRLLRVVPPGAPSPTERERGVLNGLAAGKTREQIGGELGFSPRTVKRVIVGLEEKLKARKPSLLLMKAALYGLVDDEPGGPTGPAA